MSEESQSKEGRPEQNKLSTNEIEPGKGSIEPQFSISRENWTNFVEMDLWGRFQTRLWKLVGGFLTVMALASIFGIPYFIKTEINNRLQETKTAFAQQENEVITYSKFLDLAQLQYSDELGRFTADAYALMRNTREALAKLPEADPSTTAIRNAWNFSGDSIMGLLGGSGADQDFNPISRVLDPKSPLFKVKVSEPTMIYTQIVSSAMSTSAAGGHPVRNGTFGGEAKDLLYRSVYLRANEMTIQSLRSDLLSIAGGDSRNQRTVTVQFLFSAVYLPRFKANLKTVMGSQLNKDDSADLDHHADLYAWPNPLGASN